MQLRNIVGDWRKRIYKIFVIKQLCPEIWLKKLYVQFTLRLWMKNGMQTECKKGATKGMKHAEDNKIKTWKKTVLWEIMGIEKFIFFCWYNIQIFETVLIQGNMYREIFRFKYPHKSNNNIYFSLSKEIYVKYVS